MSVKGNQMDTITEVGELFHKSFVTDDNLQKDISKQWQKIGLILKMTKKGGSLNDDELEININIECVMKE